MANHWKADLRSNHSHRLTHNKKAFNSSDDNFSTDSFKSSFVRKTANIFCKKNKHKHYCPKMCGSKVRVCLLFFLVSLVQITPADFYHLDRFNRACIRNHGCDGDVVNIKMQVSKDCNFKLHWNMLNVITLR